MFYPFDFFMIFNQINWKTEGFQKKKKKKNLPLEISQLVSINSFSSSGDSEDGNSSELQ